MSNPYAGTEPRALIDMLRYALTVAERSPDADLRGVAPDLAEAAWVLIPAAEWLEERDPVTPAPAPSATFGHAA